jgi:hypothetical protein
MGMRAADIAELTARNGGAIQQAPLVTPDIEKLIAYLTAGQATNYTQLGMMGQPKTAR